MIAHVDDEYTENCMLYMAKDGFVLLSLPQHVIGRGLRG